MATKAELDDFRECYKDTAQVAYLSIETISNDVLFLLDTIDELKKELEEINASK